jgi:dTDP-4-dehydrorhamnose reductase
VIVVTGATGQLGTAFCALLPDAHCLRRTDLDLVEPAAVFDSVATLAPSAIINCAAYTKVDAAEEHEVLAYAINATSVGELARYAAAAAIPFVTFSTDYVFPGNAQAPYLESSPTGPINAYGRTKLAGEEAALSAYAGSLVVRTSWVISGTHANFVATMLRLAREGKELKVVDDQVGSPTIAADLARVSLAAMEQGVTGILHLTNQGTVTWFGLAIAAAEIAGLDVGVFRPCTTADYPTPAARPAYSVLGSERLADMTLPPMPDWRDSLPGVVEALQLRAT